MFDDGFGYGVRCYERLGRQRRGGFHRSPDNLIQQPLFGSESLRTAGAGNAMQFALEIQGGRNVPGLRPILVFEGSLSRPLAGKWLDAVKLGHTFDLEL